jgi:hypothetical protein
VSDDELRAAAERLAGRDPAAYHARDRGHAEVLDGMAVARAYLDGLVVDDVRVLRLKAAIAAVLPDVETPHVRAALRAAVEDAR